MHGPQTFQPKGWKISIKKEARRRQYELEESQSSIGPKAEGQEEWRWISGYEGLYKISSFGRVFRVKRPTGKSGIMKLCENDEGYTKAGLSIPGKDSKSYFVHRLVADAFLENHLNKPVVNHKDFDPRNNRVENLEWSTEQENMMHAYIGGRLIPPKHNVDSYPNAKLSHSDVREIRSRVKGEDRHSDIAKEYGICTDVVSRIARGKTWKSLS